MTRCVSYQRSLEILMLHNMSGTYGCRGDEQCSVVWNIPHREGWNQALINAEKRISTYLGQPLCPQQICSEIHLASSQIRLKNPIAYLGNLTHTAWVEDVITYMTEDDPPLPVERPYIMICQDEIGNYDITDVEFSYPDEILSCYRGKQVLQAPCIEAVEDCGDGTPGWMVSWELCQLVSPLVDEVVPLLPDNLASFIESVKWRISYVDETDSVSLVGECRCGQCYTRVTATLLDAEEGLICLNGVACSSISRVKVNYGASYRCVQEIDPTLEDAVVTLAVVNTAGTIAKPCGCDNRMWEELLEMDETARTDFGSRLRFGGTVGGMRVMRVLEDYLMDRERNPLGKYSPVPSEVKTYLAKVYS